MGDLAEFTMREAVASAVKQFSELYDKVEQKDLDIPKVEWLITNAFSAGALWKEKVCRKEISEKKNYLDGLQDMYDIAVCEFDNILDSEDFEALMDAKKDVLRAEWDC